MEREYEWYTGSAGWVKEVLNKIGQMVSAKYIAIFGYHKEYINILGKRLIDKEGKVCKCLTV
jgi:hypothetical protein